MLLILALLIPCAVALLLRGRTPRDGARFLAGRYAPVVVGLLWAGLSWATWGSWHPMPLDHDEVAYLLQAEIFADGRWAMPAPPLPDFFGQAHVLVTPVLASKYPPGHSLLLALGTLFANYNFWLLLFVIVTLIVLWFMPRWTQSIITRLGATQVSEPEIERAETRRQLIRRNTRFL